MAPEERDIWRFLAVRLTRLSVHEGGTSPRAVFIWVYPIVRKTLDACRSLLSTPIGGRHDCENVIPAKAGIQNAVYATANRFSIQEGFSSLENA